MTSARLSLCTTIALALGAGGCGGDDPAELTQNQTMEECEADEALVEDVCVELGPDDGCVATADRCIRHCTGADECAGTEEGMLCPLDPWPVAPEGYCVVSDALPVCGANEELVEDVCVELGPDDGCVETDDRCIRHCTEEDECAGTEEGMLCPLDPWPVAPDGYCVVPAS